MKKLLFILFVGLAFSSCTKTMIADFENISNKTVFDINELIAIDNKSENYETFFWETKEYDNSGTSSSSYLTYDENYREVLYTEGKKEIVLHIFSKDKKEEKTKSIIIEIQD